MPMHDWSKVKPGTYHNFHQLWTSCITNQLNTGILPLGCFAMAEQIIGGPEPDVVALKLFEDPLESSYQQTWDGLPIELKRMIAPHLG